MIFCNKNYFWTLFVVAVSLSVAQHGSVFCETKTIDLIGDVISMYLSPIDVDGLSSGDNSFIIGEKFSMYIKADINDPKVRAEIKEGTLEWRLKSVTFYYYVPSENELGYERVKEATFIDNNTLANSPYHPITFSRPIGVWGKCATWQIVKTSANPHNESSTFNSPGTWDVEFEIEFQGKHKDIKDCMVQSNTRGTKWNFALKHYLGMIVDDYAVEGTDDVLGVQFGIVNKDMKSEKRIADIRLFFEAFFKIDWATDNNIGLVENDFIRMNPNSLSIFRSKNENGMDETNKVERYNNAFNQYFININRNFWGQNETVTSNFFLKADNGPNTETKLIENAKISIMDYQRGNLSTPLQIKYYVITTDIQENLGTNYPHGTEGRYLVSVSEINVIKATTLFGGKNNSNITGIRQGHPDAPADNGINLN
ncbi:MAG: hypothetical protein LBT09_12900, partial [Planctomycetaceae bacterium]|nr:hypothetical protein [Planctomycetaceae bacterium]